MEVEKQQQFEWIEAQKIAVGVDLVAVAKQHLQFLAAVDRNRHLYEGPALERAIYRYNACWLPLLAQHSQSQIFEGPLVVPLDCEWVWHCHRLNPVRYKSDCEELFGRILDNSDVVSTVQGVCGRQTEEIWNKMYPDEPYHADLVNISSEDITRRLVKCTKYDLVSAAKRQSPFFYQVSRPHMTNDVFIKEAVARYKGFLYLIKRNKENGIRKFCVPTYDIDLIWHSHQLCSVSYCKDLEAALGKVLEHDDMDSDRTKGKKLDTGFSGTTQQWEQTFGTRYWKAGAMYRGNAPSPVTSNPSSNMMFGKVLSSTEHPLEIQLQERKVVEVLLEFVGVKNLPEGHRGSLTVVFSKSQPDIFFDAKRKLSILSEAGEKQVASFQCEPTGALHFELMSHSSTNLARRSSKTLGSASLWLQEYLDPVSKLSTEKWLALVSNSGTMSSEPILLRVAISFTTPAPAPCTLEMIHSRPFSKNSCLFNFPVKPQHSKSWTHVTDETGTRVISLQMRDLKKARDTWISGKEVIGLMKSGETQTLAGFVGNGWSVMDNFWFFHLPNKCRDDGHLFVVTGTRLVKVFPGRKLDYEPRNCGKQGDEMDFLTAVEFSTEYPYGKAVALLDLRSGFVTAKEKWMIFPGIILAFIASNILKKEGYEGIIAKSKDLEIDAVNEKMNPQEESRSRDLTHSETANGGKMSGNITNEDKGIAEKTEFPGEGHGGECGASYGIMIKCAGCSSCHAAGCGGGFGSMIKSGDCGAGGCGAGCGAVEESGKSGSCGAGGCGAGCGAVEENGKSGAGGCGTGCGALEESGKSGGKCGGCGAGGCGAGCGGCGGGCGVLLDGKCGIEEQQNEGPNPVNEAVAA